MKVNSNKYLLIILILSIINVNYNNLIKMDNALIFITKINNINYKMHKMVKS